MVNAALDEQALKDTINISEVKQFIVDVRKKRQDYLAIADRSWREIEKRNENGKLYGGNDLDQRRKWIKFPLWWSCWKIRQPITFARLPIPVLKDTQGDDPYGRTACVIGERLTRGILKTFDAFSEFSSAVDDFLVTNFGQGRAYYRREECVEEEKIRLEAIEQQPAEPEMGPDGQPMPVEEVPPIYITPEGEQVAEPLFDDMGPYILSGQEITVDNEEVYFEAGLYSGLYVDPDARKWNAVTRLAYEYQYSYREFVAKFGEAALAKLSLGSVEEHRSGKPIIVFEYHDKFLKECRWFAENSEDFFQPKEIADIDVQALREVKEKAEAAYMDNSDLYGLSGFFPCVEPLLMNASTKDFWPTPEYFQIMDILDDTHGIVRRMFLLTKAIRIRFFFDSSIPQLQQLIGETGEGGGLGIPNLQETLMNNNGNLQALVAYFPVKDMIEGLQNMYSAFEQRLNMFYQVTGLSDLIRGQTNPDSDKTFGERQMEGKFALNRIEPFQRKVQEWVKDNYQLLMEMGLKMFSDKTLDEYITPQTLDDEDKQRYVAALELLKNNKRRRFRVDFETDSTVQINEQWKRAQAIETANTITKMMEGIAKVAETQPELAATELKIAEHVVGELSDGKLFVDEIQDSIADVIERVKAPREPEFDKDRAAHALSMQKLGLDDRFRYLEFQAKQQLEAAKLGQKSQHDQITQQLAQIKMQIEQGADAAALQLSFAKLQADIAQGWEVLNLKKAEMLQVAEKEGGKQALDAFRAQIEARVASKEMSLAEAEQALEAYRVQMEGANIGASLQERVATEQRLQEEHQMNKEVTALDSLARLTESMTPEAPKVAPVTIDKSTTIHVKAPEIKKPKRKK